MALFGSDSSSAAFGTEQGNQAGKDALNLNVSAGDDQNSDISIGDFITDNSVHQVDNSDRSVHQVDNSDRSVSQVDNSDHSVTQIDQSQQFNDHSVHQTDNSTNVDSRDFSVHQTDQSQHFTDQSVHQTDSRTFNDHRDQSLTQIDQSVTTITDAGAIKEAAGLSKTALETVERFGSTALASVSGAFDTALNEIQETQASSEERGFTSIVDLTEKLFLAVVVIASVAVVGAAVQGSSK